MKRRFAVRRKAHPVVERSAASARALPDAAVLIGGLTAAAYVLDYAYQYGQASFYGFPPEYIRISLEWTTYVAALLLIAAGFFWLFGSSLHAGFDWLAGRRQARHSTRPILATKRGTLVWFAILLSTVALTGWYFARSDSFARLFLAVAMLGAIALAELSVMRRVSRWLKWLTVGFASLILLTAFVGYATASAASEHFRVAGTNLLVLSSGAQGSSWIVAPYDAQARVIKPVYRVLRSTESSPVAIENVVTGRLTVAEPAR